jgi:serine/threonine-protein kinase RsbW
VRHARAVPGAGVNIGWECAGDAVQLRVTDGGSGKAAPHVRDAGPADINGRGLAVVRTLAEEWGVEQGDEGTTVWARIITPYDDTSTVSADTTGHGSRH